MAKLIQIFSDKKNVKPVEEIHMFTYDVLVFAPYDISNVGEEVEVINTVTTDGPKVVARIISEIQSLGTNDRLYIYTGGRDGYNKLAYKLAQSNTNCRAEYFTQHKAGHTSHVHPITAKRLLGGKDEPTSA